MSACGVDYGHDGKIIKKLLAYKTLGLSLDFLLHNRIITDYPNLIKIDVDGIEHLILAGAVNTLKHPSCKTVLVEIDESFAEQAKSATKILLDCGFKLKEKKAYKKNSPLKENWDNLVNAWYSNGADIYRRDCKGTPYTKKAREEREIANSLTSTDNDQTERRVPLFSKTKTEKL